MVEGIVRIPDVKVVDDLGASHVDHETLIGDIVFLDVKEFLGQA